MTFQVVGIGASAGGLEAVSGLLSGLTHTTGMAFVLVQHLDPQHDSMLTEILAKRTPLLVAEARDGTVVEPDHLYIIPPNTSLTLVGDRLRLAARGIATRPHKPIDLLLESLALACGDQAIGVILSGSGSDGTRGLQAIKAAGGLSFAEDPASATFADMPRSAIKAGYVDFVLTAAAIGEALVRVSQHDEPQEKVEGATEDPEAVDAGYLRDLFKLLNDRCGIDFAHYKPNTLQRRLERRMAMRPIAKLGAYVELLKDDPTELNALCQDLLIRVTGFFRDPETFKVLAGVVFPALVAERAFDQPIRIWVPGCASGEEVYSFAICLVEFLSAHGLDRPVQIFGTDVSDSAIALARAGRYAASRVADDVSEERRRRFFELLDDDYRIAKPIRELCLFARQNVTSDPPFSKLDVVSCRNLLIYLDHVLQKHVIPQFHYALKPRGFLVLGPSENIGAAADLFELVDQQHQIYRRLAVPARPVRQYRSGRHAARPGLTKPVSALEPVDARQGQRDAERLLLSRYAPACILVDEGMHVLYFQGNTSRYLAHAPGPASLNLQKLARPALLVEVVRAMRAVRRDGAPVRRDGIRIEADGGEREISLEVIPRKLPDAEGPCYLILFESAAAPPGVAPSGAPAWFARWRDRWGTARSPDATPPAMAEDPRALQLQRELESARDYLQATIEQHETAVEELQTTHEELLSANEEFQSTNEELETAKEELQSSNEELITTNEELRLRNHQLSELTVALEASRDYAQAIIETMAEALLVLDGTLRVMHANQAFYTRYETTREATERRFVYDLGDGQWDIPGLRTLLEEILPKDTVLRDYEVSHDFPSVGPKTLRLNARRLAGDRQRPELILLAIDDVSERAALQRAAVAEKERYRITLASIGEGVISTDPAGGVEYLNGVAEQYTGWSSEEARGRSLSEVFNALDASTRKPLTNVAQTAIASHRTGDTGTHLKLLRRDGQEFSVDAVAAPLHDGGGDQFLGAVVSFRDVTAQRELAEQLSYQASHDALTGLVNRREFERRLKRVIASAAPQDAHALLYLDLDQFKLVNDTCGHAAGDELLRQVTAILQTQMRVRDTLARLGGDEFGVLLEHCPIEEALRVANGLRNAVHGFRFAWQNQHFTLGISIGVVSVVEADGGLEAVLSAADRACYAAKDAGRNRVHVYQLEDLAMARRHGDMQWVPRIQRALAEGRFRLYYQPIVALGPDGPSGEWGEILLRLIDEQGQLILPGAFIPAAERYDQMVAIDRWVVSQTLAALRAQPLEVSPRRYAINVSGQSLGNEELLEFVSEQLDGIAPERVCFEITESAAISNLRAASHFIATLQARGCRFSLDDFGSGLSSFAYLKSLPVDYLKIDGNFVRDMQENPLDRAIVEATHRIGGVLRVETIAESVENTATRDALAAMGVDYAQGFGIAPPRALDFP